MVNPQNLCSIYIHKEDGYCYLFYLDLCNEAHFSLRISFLFFPIPLASNNDIRRPDRDYMNSCRYEYRWADGVTIKKPIEVSAPKYVEYLMDWIEAQLDDESVFPQKLGKISILMKLEIHANLLVKT